MADLAAERGSEDFLAGKGLGGRPAAAEWGAEGRAGGALALAAEPAAPYGTPTTYEIVAGNAFLRLAPHPRPGLLLATIVDKDARPVFHLDGGVIEGPTGRRSPLIVAGQVAIPASLVQGGFILRDPCGMPVSLTLFSPPSRDSSGPI